MHGTSSVIASRSEIRAAVSDTEVPVTEEWRSDMKASRVAAGISQTELGDLVGCGQGTISQLERHVIDQSKFAPAIAVALGISVPTSTIHTVKSARWMRVFDALQKHAPGKLDSMLEFLEADIPDDGSS